MGGRSFEGETLGAPAGTAGLAWKAGGWLAARGWAWLGGEVWTIPDHPSKVQPLVNGQVEGRSARSAAPRGWCQAIEAEPISGRRRPVQVARRLARESRRSFRVIRPEPSAKASAAKINARVFSDLNIVVSFDAGVG